jgi:hypothetical protein
MIEQKETPTYVYKHMQQKTKTINTDRLGFGRNTDYISTIPK